MAKKQIIQKLEGVLRSKAAEISLADIAGPRVRRLIADMKETLAASNDGVGLAAPQVGAPLRLFIISSEAARLNTNSRIGTNDTNENTKKEWEYFVFINPVLKKHSRKKNEMAEGCLSLPGKFGILSRAEKVFLEWLDEQGKKHSRGFTKFFARVIQHEMDHLEGILISDRAKKLISIHKEGRQ